ncbi:carbohydrate kinase family protein [Curtobacterium sp. Leaf261]|uniref:carbohydrate kinase family protein n=1 Tax=Curtobacterium sp. Leaf261 TaxID=1736311 RepID=UPI00138EEB26|nr:PfkB family carbohydrate kinase [Curtobacterium sp. Leaf261]
MAHSAGLGRRRRGAGTRFLVVGDALDAIIVVTDLARTGPDHDLAATIRQRPDGSGANTAAWLGWLGAEVDFVGRVGVDDVHRHEQSLRNAGVTPHIGYDAGAATGAVVSVQTRERRVAMADPAAGAALDPLDVDPDLVEQADVVHVTGAAMLGTTTPEHLAGLVHRAKAGGARVSIDPSSPGQLLDVGPERFLRAIDGADLLLPDLAEGRALTGLDAPDDVAAALARHVPLVVLTLGDAGVVIARAGRTPQRVAAPDVEVVDSLGAGDAFAAGFLCAWATDPVRVGAAAREGARVAARALSVIGGRPPV